MSQTPKNDFEQMQEEELGKIAEELGCSTPAFIGTFLVLFWTAICGGLAGLYWLIKI